MSKLDSGTRLVFRPAELLAATLIVVALISWLVRMHVVIEHVDQRLARIEQRIEARAMVARD